MNLPSDQFIKIRRAILLCAAFCLMLIFGTTYPWEQTWPGRT